MKKLLWLICLMAVQTSAWDFCCRRRKNSNPVKEFSNIVSKYRMAGNNNATVLFFPDYTIMGNFSLEDQAKIVRLLESASQEDLLAIREINRGIDVYFAPFASVRR